jgi:cell division septal protein FtsQ
MKVKRGEGLPRGARRRGAEPTTPAPRTREPRRAAARPARRGADHARPRGPRIRLPRLGGGSSGARILAALLALGCAGALIFLANGPWLRVSSVAWAGVRYTADDRLAAVLDPVRGTSLLAVDAGALARQLEALPAVASAQVQTRFPDGVAVELVEKTPAFIWRTSAVQLVVAADGSVFGEVARTAALPADLASLPFVDDQRAASRNLIIGDRVPAEDLTTALRLEGLDPAALGSTAAGLSVRLDDTCGYSIQPRAPGSWRAIFGSYALQEGDAAAITARITDQVDAVRTLFAAHRENTVGWVDARNPGKVYWRPNGPGGSDTC